MKIECVSICINYADYLSHFLLHNKYIYDNIVIVTSNNDIATHKVCEYFHVMCVKTNVEEGNINKGKLINLGLSNLQRDGWVVHQDADTICPPRMRYLLEIAKLREDTLYGCHRVMCPSYEEWAKWVSSPRPMHECDIYIHNNWPWPLGTQIGKLSKHPEDPSDLGFCVLGFWQCWFEGGKNHMKYPENHTGFSRSDLLFNYQWPRERRSIVPEITLIHLQTDDMKTMGCNWKNRVSQRFGPI